MQVLMGDMWKKCFRFEILWLKSKAACKATSQLRLINHSELLVVCFAYINNFWQRVKLGVLR